MGVSREAAGLPWKRETTMERGGCHYLFNENDSSGSGGVRLVWRRVTDENDNVWYTVGTAVPGAVARVVRWYGTAVLL